MDAQTELKRIAHELRAYNPAADEYKGKHIHGVWARGIDAVLAALSDAAQAPVEMSPEFTDSARAALVWVLYHHQGGSSPVGQPIRFALGMGAHEPLTPSQIGEALKLAEASRWPYARELPRAAPAIPQAAGDAAQATVTDDEILDEYAKHVRTTYAGGVNVLSAMEPEGFVKAVRALLSARATAPQAGATLTEEVIAEAVKKWFPDRSYQASFFARALLSPQTGK